MEGMYELDMRFGIRYSCVTIWWFCIDYIWCDY